MNIPEPAPDLYPLAEPFATQQLAVSEGHQIYVQQFGNPDGIPVFYLHGGPGGCGQPKHAQVYDPAKYHIIIHDQRGGGNSTPYGKASLQANTTQHLIADMEVIRTTLGIDKMLLHGNSWGSTLALAYSQKYPMHVLGIALGAVFLGEQWAVDWALLLSGGAQFFPQEYADFLTTLELKPSPNLSSAEVLTTLNVRLSDNRAEVSQKATLAALTWLDRLATPAWQTSSHAESNNAPAPDFEFLTAMVQVEVHYQLNQFFVQPQQLLHNMLTLQTIPAFIVHGQYDLLCPVQQAYQLHQAWPTSQLKIVADAGHSSSGFNQYLRAAFDAFTPQSGFQNLAQAA